MSSPVDSAGPAPSPAPEGQRLYLIAGLWAFALLVLVVFHNVVMVFAGAALIAYLIAPLVDRIAAIRVGKQRNIPRWVALLCVYALFFLAVYLFLIGLVPQLYRELARITQNFLGFTNSLTPERIEELSIAAEGWLNDHGVPVELSHRALEGTEFEGPLAPDSGLSLTFDVAGVVQDAAQKFSSFVRTNVGQIVAASQRFIGGVLASVFMLFFILMVAAFFSIDIRNIKGYVRSLIPARYADDVRILAHRIDRSLSGVVRGQVTICVVNGILTFIGLLIFGVKFAFLLATVATVFSLIPIFGTIISSVPIVLIGLSQSWKTGLAALLWIIGIHALEAYFLNPKIMGSAARIHPVVIAFALIAGERTFGLIGALFAVPIAAVVVACFDFVRQKALPDTVAAQQ